MDKTSLTITGQSGAPDIKFDVAGYIAYDTAGEFEKALSDSIKDNPESITVDMEKVTVFTSIGIRVLLKVYKTTKEKGIEFQIVNPADIVKSVLKLSNLAELLLK